jgi:hypothetical protein
MSDTVQIIAIWVAIVSGVWGVAFSIIAVVYHFIKKIKIKSIVLINIITAVAVLGLSLIIPIFFQPPKPPTDFKVTSMLNDHIVRQEDLPVTIKGTASSRGTGTVWVLLVDTRQQYYLQTPPVRFLSDHTWVVNNIQPLVGIVEIDFVFVDRAGNEVFKDLARKMMENPEESKAFIQLPDNSETLASINITSQATIAV